MRARYPKPVLGRTYYIQGSNCSVGNCSTWTITVDVRVFVTTFHRQTNCTIEWLQILRINSLTLRSGGASGATMLWILAIRFIMDVESCDTTLSAKSIIVCSSTCGDLIL